MQAEWNAWSEWDDFEKFLGGSPAARGVQAASGSAAAADNSNARTEGNLQALAVQPPESSITGGSSSHQGTKPPTDRSPGGCDWLSVSLRGFWDDYFFKKLMTQLEEQKDAANDKGGVGFEGPDGEMIYVRPHGQRFGPWFFDYSVETGGATIWIAKRQNSEKIPNVVVHLTSNILMQLGHEEAFKRCRKLLERLGWHYESSLVCRVDLCVDLVDVPVQWFVMKWANGHYVSRSRKFSLYGEGRGLADCSGLVMGKGIRCRIYDKVLETKDNPTKREIMRVHRWGGDVPEYATRVEFQLRREEMREDYDIKDVYDLFSKLRTITTKLTSDWLRFSTSDVDREGHHQSRAETADVWCQVVKQFDEAFPEATAPVNKKRQCVPDVGRLTKQAFGCFLSAMAQTTATISSHAEAISVAWEHFQLLFSDNFAKLINERRDELRERQPLIGVLGESAGLVPF